MAEMNIIDWITSAIVLIGALNWGFVGAFNFNFVAWIGERLVLMFLPAYVYMIVGISAIYGIIRLGMVALDR